MSNSNERIEGQKVTENIYLCPDGKYRWIYELNMVKNPIILFTIWKIFGILILVMLSISFLIELFDGDIKSWFSDFLLSPGILIVPGIMLVLSVIAYLIVAATYGWKYMVLFEMDDEGVTHTQMAKQFEKAQALSWLTVMAGVVAGNMTTMGSGMLAASKTTSVSSFANVKKVIRKKSFNTIKVNETLEKNQIYAAKEDYDYVWDYIVCRCRNAKIVK
ncbi:MAG: hypothetical protein K6F87_00505 [Lachnospiraceae bacterium]|nr:hypothetical protein [Lachnospiraceae bacterium]